MVFVFNRLAYFAWHNTFQFHPCPNSFFKVHILYCNIQSSQDINYIWVNNHKYSFITLAWYLLTHKANFHHHLHFAFFFNWFERERKGRGQRERVRERDTNLLSHLFVHSLVDSYMCPHQRWNLQPLQIGMMLLPNELPDQVNLLSNFNPCPPQPHLTPIPEGFFFFFFFASLEVSF